MKKRDNRMDSLKGFLMILVVLHHLIGQLGYEMGGVNWIVRSVIATFHMPLFIMISGYYTKIKSERKDIFKNMLDIAIPLTVFQLISIFLLYLTTGKLQYKYLFIPYWTLWYLLSLIFWRAMLNYTPKLLGMPVLYISLAVFVSIFSGFIPRGNILSIQRTLSFYPFFLIGYYINKGIIKSKLWNNYVSYLFIVFIVVMIAFIAIGFYPEDTRVILSGVGQYHINQVPLKIVMLVVSFIISISFFNIIKENKMFANIGRDSLFYYLYHGIIIRFILYPIVNRLNFPTSLPYEVLYCCIIMTLLYFSGKLWLTRWIINPMSNR